jgi:peptide subunit release factor 1 (eRF1)
MRDLMRRLAEMEPGDLPVLTVYLDMRPQATGESPGLRAGLVVLKDRLREIEQTFWPRGPEFDSVRGDMARIERFLEGEVASETQGLAIFACSGRDLFEVVEVRTPFENQVAVGPTPDLFQLARLLDDQETAVVAVVDTNTARLFVTRGGALDEVGGPDDTNTKMYRKRSMGGWKQMHYQRNIDNNRAAFAKRAAAAIEELVDREGAIHVILAGDEVALPLLREAMSPRIAPLVQEEALRIHIRAPLDEVAAEVAPLLAYLEAEGDRAVADRLVAAVRADGLGVAGTRRTRRALEYGQVDTLLLSEAADLDEETRGELVRLATTTGAGLEVVAGHEAFEHLGGVGALLRYRHDTPAAAST